MKDYLKKIEQILLYESDPAFARRAKIIFENLNLSGNKKVLEIGCGRGFYLKTLIDIFPGLDITGIDLNKDYLSEARKFINNNKVKLIRADATSLPFKDRSFDQIIASEILEHIVDSKKALFEMFRVLSPGGTIMITVPNKNYPPFWDPANWLLEKIFKKHLPSNIWWLAGIWADHVRLYGEKELKDQIEKSGLQVEKIWQATHYCFPFSHFLLYGLGKNLVGLGLFGSLNRFKEKHKQSFLNKSLLLPLRKVDRLNDKYPNKNGVNLVFKVKK